MKLLVALLVLAPLVSSASIQKRSILDFLGLHNIDLNQLKTIITDIIRQVGSDANEQQCESACHNVLAVDDSNLIHTLCAPLCRSFQTIVHLLPIERTQAVILKRQLGDFLGIPYIDLNQLKTIVTDIIHRVGSDATEQQCESACHDVLAVDEANLIHTLCTPLCRSLQTLVHLIPGQNKRSLGDLLGLNIMSNQFVIQKVQNILDVIGSDASEQQCERVCHSSLAVDQSNLIHAFCTPLCRSFQLFVHVFNLHPHGDVVSPDLSAASSQ